MSSPSLPELTDSYRWYLCVQTKPDVWNCVKTTSEIALEKVLFQEKYIAPSKAIPISNYTPKIFDPLLLHINIHPRIKIMM
jgi:hypothetical protein